MPASCYCVNSSDDDDNVDDQPGTVYGIDDDYSLAVIADEPPTLVDDASSDEQSDIGGDNLGKYHESHSYTSYAGNCWDESEYLLCSSIINRLSGPPLDSFNFKILKNSMLKKF